MSAEGIETEFNIFINRCIMYSSRRKKLSPPLPASIAFDSCGVTGASDERKTNAGEVELKNAHGLSIISEDSVPA